MSTPEINTIVAQILPRLLTDREELYSFSELALQYVYNILKDEFEDETKDALKDVREYSNCYFDLTQNDLIDDVRCALANQLRERGYETSYYGYWHTPHDTNYKKKERELERKAEGVIFCCGYEGNYWATGEDFLRNWQSWEPEFFLSSPYEVMEVWLESEGNCESEWGLFISFLREELEGRDLTEYEDLDDALSDIDCGIFLSDIPQDYREDVVAWFEEAKAEQQPECEYEEEFE